jgi:hypothetical protein
MPVRYSAQQQKSGASIGTIISVPKPTTWTTSTNPTTESSRWNIAADYPGWLECNGQNLLVSEYPFLYQVIGNTYGGTTGVNFNLPDYRSKKLMGTGILDGNAGVGLSLTPSKSPGNSTISAQIDQPGSEGGLYTVNTMRQLPPGSEITPSAVPNTGAIIGGDADDTFSLGSFRSEGFDVTFSEVQPNFSGNVSWNAGNSSTGTGNRLVSGVPPHIHTWKHVRRSNTEACTGNPYYVAGRIGLVNESTGGVIRFDRGGDPLVGHSHMIAWGFPGARQTYSTGDGSGTLSNSTVSAAGNTSNQTFGTSSNLGNLISQTIDAVNILGVTLNPGKLTMNSGNRIAFDNALDVRLQCAEEITLMTAYFRLKYLIKAY